MNLPGNFNPSAVITESEFSELFGQSQYFELGQVTSHDTEDVIKLADLWVSKMDTFIYKAQRNNVPHYRKVLLRKRAFTYHEFTLLFKEIQEEKYKIYPIFQFLRIPSSDYLTEFRLGLESTPECFVQVLLEATRDSNGDGIGFFLHRLRNRIPVGELMRHCYISGATGSGKSELMRLLFYNLIKKSHKGKGKQGKYSLVLIDPHGDLSQQVKKLKTHINSDRFIYFEPELKPEYSPVINPLEINSSNPRAVVTYAQNLAKAIEEAVGVDMSVNMSALLIPCLSLLLTRKGSTLLDLIRLMQDDPALINEGLKLPNNAHRMIFANFRDKHYAKTKTSIFTKLQSFLNYPAFYNATIGKSTINIGRAINSGKIVVFNLSQRLFGPDASQAYGRFLISMIKSQVTMRGEFRKPTFLFVDECQNFISPSIKDILEQTRKYGLHIIMANQSVDRLGEIESVVLGNTSVKLVGKNDSIQTIKKMSSITGTDISVFQKLRNYHFYVKTSYSKGQVFKVSDALLVDSSLSLSSREEKELNKRMISKYYRKTVNEAPPDETEVNKPKFDL
ncbi:MAG: type IV secretory system conjugative DNA transfer family protein [Lewinella sp.]|uniref:type IV secretory system conjugative DNA transfer family protein n=1 Tax=Lewinella sp. TaxID=2004506 RepID=UPI003D6ABED1